VPAKTFEDPDVEIFRAQLRDWLQANVPKTWGSRFELSEAEQSRIKTDWERTLSKGGYAGVSWPLEFGGMGLGPIEEVVFYQEAARAHAPEEANVIGKHVAGPSIAVNGTTRQRERYLQPILDGVEIWCEGFSEPDAGSDLAAVQTTADIDGDMLRITGHKIWTSNAHIADLCWLLARTSREQSRRHNVSMVIVDMHQEGVEVVPIRDLTGERHFNEVSFNGAVAPIENVVGEINEGWQLASVTGFRAGRQAITGGLRRYLFLREWADTLVDCCASGPGQRAEAERLSMRVELVSWQVMRSAELVAQGRNWHQSTSVLHVYWGELMQDLTAFGVATRCARHREHWRHLDLQSRSATIYGGTAQIQKNVIATRVLGLKSPR
jgi:alkylation response protein AidB-like acyl-CoA dehydrogenase